MDNSKFKFEVSCSKFPRAALHVSFLELSSLSMPRNPGVAVIPPPPFSTVIGYRHCPGHEAVIYPLFSFSFFISRRRVS